MLNVADLSDLATMHNYGKTRFFILMNLNKMEEIELNNVNCCKNYTISGLAGIKTETNFGNLLVLIKPNEIILKFSKEYCKSW